MRVLIFLFLLQGSVFAMDSIMPKEQPLKAEPIVQIDRYNENQFRNDESVLIAGVSGVQGKRNEESDLKDKVIPYGNVRQRSVLVKAGATPASTSPIQEMEFIGYEEDKYDLTRLSPELANKVRERL